MLLCSGKVLAGVSRMESEMTENTEISISCFMGYIHRFQKLRKSSLDSSQSFSGARLWHFDDRRVLSFCDSKRSISNTLEI